MDGNGRWAKRRGLPRTAGHTEGEENLASLVRVAVTRDVGWLTVFGFSTENWIRPRGEVRHILGLHRKLFGRVAELNELNVRVQWMGRPFDTPAARTPKYVQRAIDKAITDTAGNTGMVLTVAFDYGSRTELVHAAEQAVAAGETISESTIAQHLYLPDLPPVDVLVRTSGELRISNFMLWQIAGAKVYFTGRTWPEFDGAELDAALSLTRALVTTDAPPSGRSPRGPGVVAALAAVTAALPAAEDRPGQREMAAAIDTALARGRHIIVEAGTGTGKTMGYLVPAVLSGKRVVVATATKALQDQLAAKDLPFLTEHLATSFGTEIEWAVLKGRSNYLCLQRLRELQQGQLEIDDLAPTIRLEIKRLGDWAGTTASGDLAELDWAPSDAAARAVTVGSDECPGAARCPLGQPCFAERARQRAMAADVVVVNLHLYGLHVASGGLLLPEHDVVIVDEAHQLEDIMSDTVGVQIGPGRFTTLAAALRRIIDDPVVVGGVAESASAMRELLGPHLGKRLPVPLPQSLQDGLILARSRIDTAQTALRKIETEVEEAKQRKLRGQTLATRLQDQIDTAIGALDGKVAFVSGGPEHPRLELAPLDVGPVLANGIWSQRTAVLTSATIPSSLATRVGLEASRVDQIDVGSPFDYEHHGLLYCALHLPDPRSPLRDAAVAEEIAALVLAAGGRTLALFTSYKAMDAAAAAVRLQVDVPILTQRDLPKNALVKQFSEDESACLFATSGFFQGVDIPGRTLSQVIIDKIPFPRPDDPLLSARRDLLGAAAFSQIDVPRAAMLLAQATGRLIRTAHDRGVVAVLDPRLGKANYRWDIVRALPPMRRTRHRADAEAFLREITA